MCPALSREHLTSLSQPLWEMDAAITTIPPRKQSPKADREWAWGPRVMGGHNNGWIWRGQRRPHGVGDDAWSFGGTGSRRSRQREQQAERGVDGWLQTFWVERHCTLIYTIRTYCAQRCQLDRALCSTGGWSWQAWEEIISILQFIEMQAAHTRSLVITADQGCCSPTPREWRWGEEKKRNTEGINSNSRHYSFNRTFRVSSALVQISGTQRGPWNLSFLTTSLGSWMSPIFHLPSLGLSLQCRMKGMG